MYNLYAMYVYIHNIIYIIIYETMHNYYTLCRSLGDKSGITVNSQNMHLYKYTTDERCTLKCLLNETGCTGL